MRGLGRAARAALSAASSSRGAATDLAETSLFTRYTSPVPSAFDHTAVLGAPPTKARLLRACLLLQGALTAPLLRRGR